MSRKAEPTSVLIELEPVFERNAPKALANTQLRRNMGKATQTIRNKRANVVAELDDWEALREAGRAIKAHTLRNLDTYLIQLEESVTKAGGHIHWASDAAEANQIIAGIVQSHQAKEVIKIKSLTTD
ncbi:MAG: lactate utilization protein, partial [Caldilineaceae bacterium]|nr:lactate utilization protein [Caldilineaceae bacterium]